MDDYFVKAKPGAAGAKAAKAEQNKFRSTKQPASNLCRKPYDRPVARVQPYSSHPSVLIGPTTTADNAITAATSRQGNVSSLDVTNLIPSTAVVGRASKPRMPQSSFHSSAYRDTVKSIVSTLKDPSNKITHSNSYERAQHVMSCATGHQQSNSGRSREDSNGWAKGRMAKLRDQAAGKETSVLSNVCIYINGYTGDKVTNRELCRIIERAGGTWRPVLSMKQCTHVVTSMPLSANKTQKEMQRKRGGCLIVTPDWVLESVKAGRRLPEWQFAVVRSDTQKTVVASLFGSSAQFSTSSKSSSLPQDKVAGATNTRITVPFNSKDEISAIPSLPKIDPTLEADPDDEARMWAEVGELDDAIW